MPERIQQEPLIEFCLLIPCYNNEQGLVKSLCSIQFDFHRFLVLIVDDGSSQPIDDSKIQKQLERELPLHVLRLKTNQGITAALNIGLIWIYSNVNANYVARLDCGDTCHADRFFKQVAVMNQNPELLLSGTWCRFVHPDGRAYVYRTPIGSKRIKRGMYFRNLFIHPTFMFRLHATNEQIQYPSQFPHAEDYALAWQLIKQGQVHILPEILVNCEINSTGISEAHRREQLISREKIIRTIAVNNIIKIPALLYILLLRLIPRKLILAYKLRKQ